MVRNRILELRTKLSMTQEDFAEHCGVSRISIARYEAGDRISQSSAEKIASACNVSIDWIMNRTDIPEPITGGIISQMEFALNGELRDLTEAEKQDVLAYIRFRKSQRKSAE